MNRPMEDWLLIGLVFFIGAVVMFLFRQRINQQVQLLTRQAQRRQGKSSKGNFFIFPRLILSSEGTEIQIHFRLRGKHHPDQTILEAPTNFDSDRQIKISPKAAIFKAFNFLGLKDVQMNDPVFDQAFDVKTNDGDFVLKLLSAEVRNRFLRWKPLRQDIVFGKGKMRFVADSLLLTDEDYDGFIETGLLMLKRLKAIS